MGVFHGNQGEIKNHNQFDLKGFSLFCLNFVGRNELNEAIAHSHGTLKAEMIFCAQYSNAGLTSEGAVGAT